jgi:four helix bundle protein
MQNDKEKFKKDFKRRLYNFTLRLIALVDKLAQENISRRLGDQLLRSGTSIIGNYVEAQSASSRRDFVNYFTTALKSANESKLWISLLRDSGRLTAQDADNLLDELNEISKILASSILTLKKRK